MAMGLQNPNIYKDMKAEEIIIKEKYKSLKNLVLICDAMDEFAEALIKENNELKKQLEDEIK